MGSLLTGWKRGALGAALVALAACGLDESGVTTDAGGNDVFVGPDGGPDVVADVAPDVPLPPSCATTAVTCFALDGGLPDGWTPYVFARDGGACPAGDFQRADYVTNARLSGGCACATCAATGTWSCSQPLVIATGHSGCMGGTDVADSGSCQQAAAQDDRTIQLVDASATATGSGIGCEAGAPTPGVVDSDPVAICGPGCDAGATAVCGQSDTASRCIVASGIQTCPGDLTRTIIGTGGNAACAACTCSASAAPACTASAKIFFNSGNADTNCSGTAAQTLTLDGTCQSTNADIQSYVAGWNDPGAPTCAAAGGGGDAGLAGPLTVCCTN